MLHSDLAMLLVEGDATPDALFNAYSALADVQLAYSLKDICLDGWSSNPQRSLRAASAMRSLLQRNSHPEIVALCEWTSGLESLIDGRMSESIRHLEVARTSFLALGKPHTAAATEVSKVIGLSLLGRYDEAVSCGLRSREVFLAQGDLLAAGKIEHNLGNLCFRRDRYLEAEEFHSSAKARFHVLGDEKQLATINNCLANTHALLHKFQSAEDLYEQALQQAEAAGLPVTLAEIEGNIGTFALLRGRYDRALDYLERSRRRYAALGMPHQSAIAEQEIADAYLELNSVPEAAEIYGRLTQTYKELGLQAEEARALAYHGRAAGLLRKPQEALALLENARLLYAAEGNRVGEAMVLLSEAQLHYAQENFQVAEALAAKAEPILQSSGSWQRLMLTHWLQGELHRVLGHSDRAKEVLTNTLNEATRKGQPQVAQRCETTLGQLEMAAGNPEIAELHFRRAIALIEELRAPLPGEDFRTSFFSNKLVPYTELLRLCLSRGAEQITEALRVVESARSRALSDRMGWNLDRRTEDYDEFEADLLRQADALGQELNYIYHQIDRPPHDDNAAAKEKASLALQESLRERESRLLEISRQLHHRAREFAPIESFNLEELQRQLGRDTALVEYTTIGDELLAFVVTNERVEVLRNLAPAGKVAAEIRQVRFQIDTLRTGSSAMRKHLPALTERVRKHLASLYDLLMRRIEDTIGDRERLVIVPERDLHYLPFQALCDGKSYLIERRQISSVPSALVLQQCFNSSRRSDSSSLRRFETALLLGVADARIPLVHEEIEGIAQVFPGARIFLDGQATIAALRGNLEHMDIIHLACHADFRADNPLFSSLHIGNGRLTVRDAYRLPLECNLVTLSGCETGVNTIAPGEELMGLARGFFAAGSPSVLLSLWTVDDQATTRMMIGFYAALKRTQSPSAALREAQLDLLSEMPHPFFWSPFVLMGQW